MAKCVIMRGIPGSGKSTYVAKHYPDALVCSTDHFFEMNSGYRFDGSKLGEAHGQCLRRFVEAMQHGVPDVVVDNTNISISELSPYASLALAYGYDMEVITLKVDPSVAYARGLHGVPFMKLKVRAMALERVDKHFPKRWTHTAITET